MSSEMSVIAGVAGLLETGRYYREIAGSRDALGASSVSGEADGCLESAIVPALALHKRQVTAPGQPAPLLSLFQ